MPDHPIKVLHVFPGGCSAMGGAETQSLHYLMHADARRVKAGLVLLGRNALFESGCEAAGFSDVTIIDPNDRHPWHPAVIASWRRFLHVERPDLVHLFGLRQEIMTRPVTAGVGGIRIVSAIRGLETHRSRLAVALNRWTSRWVDRWISNSAPTADVFVERDGVPRDRLGVVPNGVDVGIADPEGRLRSEARTELSLGDRDVAVVCLANHLPDKRHVDLVRALADPGLRDRDLVLVLIGKKGEVTEELQALAADSGVSDKLRILGYRHDTERLLWGMDVMALVSRKEGLPSSILEGMAHGLPIVATPVASVPEIVREGENGFLVEVGDVAAIAARLAELVDSSASRAALGAGSRRLVDEEYSITAMTDALTSEYEFLCASERP